MRLSTHPPFRKGLVCGADGCRCDEGSSGGTHGRTLASRLPSSPGSLTMALSSDGALGWQGDGGQDSEGRPPKSPTLRRWVNLRSISRDFRFLLLLEGGPTGFSFSFLNWFYCVLGKASSSQSSWTPVGLPFWAGSFFTLPADVVM